MPWLFVTVVPPCYPFMHPLCRMNGAAQLTDADALVAGLTTLSISTEPAEQPPNGNETTEPDAQTTPLAPAEALRHAELARFLARDVVKTEPAGPCIRTTDLDEAATSYPILASGVGRQCAAGVEHGSRALLSSVSATERERATRTRCGGGSDDRRWLASIMQLGMAAVARREAPPHPPPPSPLSIHTPSPCTKRFTLSNSHIQHGILLPGL
jgi:hypothetical protein